MKLVREAGDLGPMEFEKRDTKDVLYTTFSGYDKNAHRRMMEILHERNTYGVKNNIT